MYAVHVNLQEKFRRIDGIFLAVIILSECSRIRYQSNKLAAERLKNLRLFPSRDNVIMLTNRPALHSFLPVVTIRFI